MNVELRPRKVILILLMLSVSFILIYIAGQIFEIRAGRTFGLFLFDPNREQSILRFYSSVMLLLCASLLSIIAVAKKGDAPHSYLYWLGLAMVFFFFAIAKISAIHEYLAGLIRVALNLSKIQLYVWVYGIAIVTLPALYLKFFLSLPKRTMFLLIVGGFTFMLGAFGFDLIVAYVDKLIDHRTVAYIGLVALEDILEMGGVIVFMYGLLLYMRLELKWIRVDIVEQ